MSHNDSPTRDSKSDVIYKLLRNELLRLDLWDVKLIAKSGEEIPIPLTSWITVKDEHFYLHLRRIKNEQVDERIELLFHRPNDQVTFVGIEEHVKLKARTENNADVILEAVSPYPDHTHIADSVVTDYKIPFWRLHITPEGFDTLNHEEMKEHFRQRRQARGENEPELTDEAYEPKDHFFAILPNAELMIFNHGTSNVLKHPYKGNLPSSKTDCFIGDVMEGSYCIEQVGEDIHIDFKCLAEACTSALAKAKFDGILQTVGFIHGCHPWPCFYRYSRNTRTLDQWIDPRSSNQRDVLRPLGHHKLLFHDNMNALDLFPRSAEFFSAKTDESDTIQEALWIMRESRHPGTLHKISVLTMCSLLEGLVKKHRGPKPKKPLKGPAAREYRWIRPIEDHFMMPFKWFLPAVEAFDAYRNPLAHGFVNSSNGKESHSILDAYSRLTGAIYMLILRRMNYTGTIQTSQLENSMWANFKELPHPTKRKGQQTRNN